MKRITLYMLLLVAALIAPVEKMDVAQLRPVEVVCLQRQDDQVILQTDTEDIGIGTDAMQALEELKRTSPAKIYLDTADYLLIGEGAEVDVEDLRQVLKPTVRVCLIRQNISLEDVGKFLQIHGNVPKLKQWKKGMELPILDSENDRLKLLKKSEI